MSDVRCELLRRIERVSAEIDPGLSDRDVERLVAGARRLGTRRAARRVAAGLAVLSLALGVVATSGGLPWRARRPTSASLADHAPEPPAAERPTPPAAARAIGSSASRTRTVRFPDGSVAVPLDDGTELTVRESSPRHIAIDVDRGRGRFEVTPGTGRTFVVRAGDITVTVLGTIFTVERVADRIGVGVERGRVLVEWGSGSARLGVGESGLFPPLQVSASPAAAPPTSSLGPARFSVASKAAGSSQAARPRPAPVDSVAVGPNVAPAIAVPPPETSADMEASPPRFDPTPPQAVSSPRPRDRAVESDSFASLLEAADLARTAGRAADATALLRRALERHGTDRRAALAAFMLGRILLVELGQPREAAAAFAQARGLAPEGPLAEDALAREVESWSRAGDAGRTRIRAQEYLRCYPTGRRLHAVRALGGVE